MKMKCVTSLSLLLFTLPLSADINSEIQATYTIGVQNFENFQPYSSFQNNHYAGFNRQLLDMFASKQGFKFEYKARPIKRLYSEFLNGTFDFKYPDNAHWSAIQKKSKYIYYSQPVVEYIDGLMVKKEDKGKKFSELTKISVMDGFTPETRYRKANLQGKLEFISARGYKRLLGLVTEGRVDGAYFDITITKNYIADSNGKERALVFDDTLPYSHGSRRLSSLKHPQIILLFDQFLVTHKAQIELLKKQYNIK